MGVKNCIEHIDTNILIRLITRDNEECLKKAEKLLSRKNTLFVFEDFALAEIIFVLSGKNYNYPREKIAAKIKAIIQIENIICDKSTIEAALDAYVASPQLSFVDCYLASLTEGADEAPLWTFDHNLAKQFAIAREP